MANFKHKVFLLIAKWIPVAVAAGILINNTLAMLDVKDVILDLFDITVGSSLAFVMRNGFLMQQIMKSKIKS